MKIKSYTVRKLSNAENNSQSNLQAPSNPERNNEIPEKKCLSKKIWIPLVIILGLGILSIIGIIIYKELKKKQKKPEEPPTYLNNLTICSSPEEEEDDGISTPDLGPLKTEFNINTKLDDLRKIKVVQKSKEETITNGKKEANLIYRITNYDIIFVKEQKSQKYQEKFFNKTYLGVIAISSECINIEKEECEPKQLIDLSDEDVSNSRNLEEITDLKDIPIPLCYFEMTDNDVIMSITCPESLSKGRKDTIVLDLYFLKPPSIERPNKDNGNIIINIEQKDDKIYVRDTDVGICSIKSPHLSNCTTDFNLTTDLEGNVLNYNELCFSNITTNERNYYIKNKITTLSDETDKYSNVNSEKYKENLNKILPLLDPYMKNNQLFNFTQFKQLYNTAKKAEKYNGQRNLDEIGSKSISNQANLFSYSSSGTDYSINLNQNPGINEQFFEFLNNFKAGEDNYNLIRLREYTNFDTILKKLSILSKAGNKLASHLYNNIKSDFTILNDIINQNITALNKLVIYQDILPFFDSSLIINKLISLPKKAVELSDYLNNGLDDILNNIVNEDLKKHIDNFKININNYIGNSHELVYKIEDNLKNLMNSLNSKKSALTEIAMYYLNNTPDSYSDTIIKVKDILMNYYKNENNSIIPKVENLLLNFESNLIKSINSETGKLNNLLPKLENKSIEIESGNDEDRQKLITSLKNSNNYLFEIISRIKEKVRKAINLKDNNYFLSNEEIESNINLFTSLINNAIKVAEKLDNDEYIDKTFDNIMINFKENFTDANKNIDKKKEEIFTLTENSLKNDYFSKSEQEQLSSDIKDLYLNISLKLIKENNFYTTTLNTKLDNFLKENKDNLKKIINELVVLFSEEKIEELSNLYDKGFESSISLLTEYIDSNKNLAKNYFDYLSEIILDNNKVLQTLYDYKQGDLPYKREQWEEDHYVYLYFHSESITSKKLTQGYINKYNKFIKNFDNSIDYIKDNIFLDFLNEYKNPLIKLKKLLQTIKNTKISHLYPDFNDLKFTDENIEKIDILYTRLNKYISDTFFNQKYISKINKFKNETNVIQNIKDYIEDLNSKIIKLDYNQIINDISNDFCYAFKTKAYYTCTNGQLNYDVDSEDYYCLHSSKYSENYKEIKDISIYEIQDINIFLAEFKTFYSLIEEKVNEYDSIMKELKNILFSIKTETLEQKLTENFLLPFENYINNLLSQKYDDNIIIGAYNFYKNDTKTKIESLLNSIADNWENIFDSLNKEIDENIDNINCGTYEFGIMAQITSTLINGNITNNFYKSIVNHQKNEMTYTISYYYNYLLRLVKSAYKYVLNRIPSNPNGFNDIIDLRKNEINIFFGNIINIINDLKEKSCSKQNQLEVLQIEEENFFDINDILVDNIKSVNESLTAKAAYPFNFYKEGSEYSFINRFYLENSQIGKQIKEFYKEIEDKSFIKLKDEEFISLINENLIFDKNEFINKIKDLINNLELKIDKLFLNEKKNYISILESKIIDLFSKDRIIQEINDLYKKGVKEMEEDKIQEIKNNINEILEKIKEKMDSESTRLSTTFSYTNDYSQIKNTLNQYKNQIFNKLNETAMSVLEAFHEEITEKLLKKYVEPMLNLYLERTTFYTNNFKEEKTLNNTYNIKKIIEEIIVDLSVEYKNITEMQIEKKYTDYKKDISEKLGLNEIKENINKEIENKYSSTLLIALQKYAIFNAGDEGYIDYDFNDDIKGEINEIINLKMNNINNAVKTTEDYINEAISINGISFFRIKSNFEIKLDPWEYSFDDSSIYYNIENNFKDFISSEYDEELDTFKNNVNEIMTSNFNELLSEIILSFGNDFFDRIIQYNENFKITGLYNNLKYSIFQTISYYIMINAVEEIEELPRDLKLKVYNLNNIDLIAKEKNKQVLDLLEGEIDKFIGKSKDKIIPIFISKIDNHVIKENVFKEEINEVLKEKLDDMREDILIKKHYINLLNENFKNNFINSYTKSMNKQLEELLEIVHEQKEQLIIEMDCCFTLEPEEVLNDIKNKLNITLESVNEYNNNYLDGFIISANFTKYLISYGNEIIKPLYEPLIDLIDESTRNIILNNIDENIKTYENNMNVDEFNELSNKTYFLAKNIYENIKTFINIYGIEGYNDNLDNEIRKIELRRNIRILNDIEDIRYDKGVSEVFSKLLENSEKITILLNSFEEFNTFNTNITDDFINLDKSFKKSKELIIKNKYDEEITNNLTQKLNYLKEITSNYYNSINESFYILKDYLNKSIYEINDLLNECENITYKTFSEKYEAISKEVRTIDKEVNENSEGSPITHNSSWENNNIIATATMGNLIKRGKFKFFYNYEKGSAPIMRIELIDESKPEQLKLEIENQFGDCGKNVQEITAYFNDVIFITYIDYNIVTNEINMTTVTNFESYDYEICKYKIGVSTGQVCKKIMGLTVCTGDNGCQQVGPRTHNTTTHERVYDSNTEIFNA